MSSIFIAELSLLLFAFCFLAYGIFKMRQPFEGQILVNTSQESRVQSFNQLKSGENEWK